MSLIDLIEALIALERRHGGETATNVEAVCLWPDGTVFVSTLVRHPMPELPEMEGVKL